MPTQPSLGSSQSPESMAGSTSNTAEEALSFTHEDYLDEQIEQKLKACRGDVAAIPTSDTLSQVGTREEMSPMTQDAWRERTPDPPLSAKLLEPRETRDPPVAKHKVVVLPPSRRTLRSPSPENNSPLVRLTRLRSPEISPRLLRPMPLFAQSSSRTLLGARTCQLSEHGRRTGSPVRCEAGYVSRTGSRSGDLREPRGGRTPVTPTVPACPNRIPSSWAKTFAPVAPLTQSRQARPSRHSVGSGLCGLPRSATPPAPCRSSSQGRLGAENRQPLNRGTSKAGPQRKRGSGIHSPPKVRKQVETDEVGRTELMHAAREGDLERAEALLCAGLPVDSADSCKCTALMYATTYGHVPVARCLIEHAANVNAQSHDRWTPLIAAVYNGHLLTAKYLLTMGANIECADERGWTALMHVAFNGKIDILQCLIDNRADVEQKDKEGRTALVYAAFGGHLPSVRLLLAASHFAAKGRRDGTPDGPATMALMFAADKGHADIVRALLDASLTSRQSRASALELAQFHGHHEVANLLYQNDRD
mmetsp:Transcript_39996/g.74557  ORF Transcript_39996/g.74557 Transcript_39996/m.74557 type:complete len:534 (-) Transcript_39996:116-1717(-)